MKWYRLAAEQGHAEVPIQPRAQVRLTVMGVPRDYQEAVRWFRLAAEQGDAQAQYNLGGRHAIGQGVREDYVQAHKWINLAASRTTTGKAEYYRSMRDQLAEKMTASQIAEAQRLAREWQPTTWEQLKDE